MNLRVQPRKGRKALSDAVQRIAVGALKSRCWCRCMHWMP